MVPDPVRLGLLPHAPQRSWQEVSWPRTQYNTACSPGHPLSPAAPSPAEDDHPPSRARRPVGSGSGASLGSRTARPPAGMFGRPSVCSFHTRMLFCPRSSTPRAPTWRGTGRMRRYLCGPGECPPTTLSFQTSSTASPSGCRPRTLHPTLFTPRSCPSRTYLTTTSFVPKSSA